MHVELTLEKSVICYLKNMVKTVKYKELECVLNGYKSIRIMCASCMLPRRLKLLESFGFCVSNIERKINPDDELHMAIYTLTRN